MNHIPRLSHRAVVRQQGRFLLAHRAQTLELDGPSFKDLLRRVERDALFCHLLDAGSPGGSLIRRRALARMRGFSSAASGDLDQVSAGPAGFDLGGTLAAHAEGVEALRRLGVERAKLLFGSDDLGERRRSLRAWGLGEEDSDLVQALIEHLSVFGAMSAMDEAVLIPGAPDAIVARLEPDPSGSFVIVPLVSYFRTERYVIDYERIAQARRQGLFSEAESKRLPSLLGEVESINYRGDTLHQILCGLADAQARFLRSGREEDIAPLTQLALAQALGAHPSAVCRAVSGRSILTPWGEERPLSAFFPGRRGSNSRAVAAILSSEPRLSDREVARRVSERFGVRISRRSATLYRRGLSIPNSYRRRVAAA